MKIAFVGMGSIGKRHLQNVCAYLEEKGKTYAIDLYRSGRGNKLGSEFTAKIHRELLLEDGILDKYDVVFITNPTAMHYETVQQFASNASAMFIEKPVFHDPDLNLESLGLSENGIYYVACPLRYHPVLQYVQKNIPCHAAYAAQAICSSYLPDWRPGSDYRLCYSAHKDMGGGVDIDLIHEWDYLTWLFGDAKTGFAIREQISNLEIDSCDIASYLARTEQAVLELHLDYFGRKSLRQLRIFLPEDTVDCDLLAGTIQWTVSGKHLEFNGHRNDYQIAEIRHFFEIIEGCHANSSTIPKALQVLRYAQGKFTDSNEKQRGC